LTQSFKHLLDLHVLFSSANAFSPDGSPLPTASLALTLDDELQYRCAGYIQAEIERHAEFLEDEEEADKSQKSSSEDEEEVNGANDSVKPSKARKAKKPRTEGIGFRKILTNGEAHGHFKADLNSRDLLEREYLFIDVISTFLRAIRAGAIHAQHGSIVLAHYGRLEVAFDTCSKVIVDVLREDTIMKENPHLIVSTITQAVQEVKTFHLNIDLDSFRLV